jgi:deazaflavin-dependent oxidoreductase (nitroreductase family)
MTFQKTPGGTRGARGAGSSNALTRFANKAMTGWHRRSGDKFQGMDLVYLTTVGAKSGQKRQVTVSRFADGDNAWLVVASIGGAASNPAWYHNIAAHPDQVWAELGGQQFRVNAVQLEGEERADAWRRITSAHPRYASYEKKTDRVIPVIRLTRAE